MFAAKGAPEAASPKRRWTQFPSCSLMEQRGGLNGINCFMELYRARFFGHKFDLSGVVHGGLLPGETRLTRAA
jgi:hypothetical protein